MATPSLPSLVFVFLFGPPLFRGGRFFLLLGWLGLSPPFSDVCCCDEESAMLEASVDAPSAAALPMPLPRRFLGLFVFLLEVKA